MICIVKMMKDCLQLNVQVFRAVFTKRGRSVPAHKTYCFGVWLIHMFTFD